MNVGPAPKRPFSHPLFGSSLTNLWSLLTDNGMVSLKYTPQLLTAFCSATARVPISIVEHIVYADQLKHMEMEPPIFIIGHWRSGTTHICNLLSRSPEFGFVTPVATGIPHDLLVLGKLVKPWLEKSIPSNRLIDRVAVNPDSPQEDEFGIANMISTSFLHGLYFPKHFSRNFSKGVFFDGCSQKEISQWINASKKYLKKVYIDQEQRQLLIRNPAYTTRVPLLKEIWPGAKFIHIYRNPFRIYPSMKNYFNKLLPALALQDYHQVKIDHTIFDTYHRMMHQVISDLSQLSASEYIEIQYEHLEERPLAALAQVYRKLDLPGFNKAKPYFEKYLDGISGYAKNQYHQDAVEVEQIKQHWGDIIGHYGYEPYQ